MKKLLLSAIACTALFAGCSADKTDFKKSAEKALLDGMKKIDPAAKVSCEDPTATAVGTTFACTATMSDGTTSAWTAAITKKDAVEVSQPSTPASPPTPHLLTRHPSTPQQADRSGTGRLALTIVRAFAHQRTHAQWVPVL